MNDPESNSWQRVAAADEIADEEAKRVTIGDCDIAVCRLGERLYAIDDICTHEYASLSDGFIVDRAIECPLHQATFHIPTGKALTGPAEDDLRTFEIKVIDGEVFVKVA